MEPEEMWRVDLSFCLYAIFAVGLKLQLFVTQVISHPIKYCGSIRQ